MRVRCACKSGRWGVVQTRTVSAMRLSVGVVSLSVAVNGRLVMAGFLFRGSHDNGLLDHLMHLRFRRFLRGRCFRASLQCHLEFPPLVWFGVRLGRLGIWLLSHASPGLVWHLVRRQSFVGASSQLTRRFTGACPS